MRKIEQNMIAAIRNLKPFNSGNTTVTITSDPRDNKGHEVNVYLHGNHIARLWYSNVAGGARDMRVSLAGWNTATTRSRLSALVQGFARVGRWEHGAGVSTTKGVPYLHDAMGKHRISETEWHSVSLTGDPYENDNS